MPVRARVLGRNGQPDGLLRDLGKTRRSSGRDRGVALKQLKGVMTARSGRKPSWKAAALDQRLAQRTES